MKLKLKAARVNNDMTINDMSEALNVSKATVCRWEKEQLPIPEDKFMEYCSICGVEPGDISAKIKEKKDDNRCSE